MVSAAYAIPAGDTLQTMRATCPSILAANLTMDFLPSLEVILWFATIRDNWQK
jgi:hypothetical protein